MRYRVGALVTGMIYDEFETESEKQAIEMMLNKHGDESVHLCAHCEDKVVGLAVSEDIDSYEVEEIGIKSDFKKWKEGEI